MTSICTVCNAAFTYSPGNRSGKYCSLKCTYVSPEWRKKQRLNKLGLKASSETKRKMSASGKGRKFTPEHIENLTQAIRRRPLESWSSGENHRWWKGGVRNHQKWLRTTKEYRWWRKAILKRDNYQCIWCGSKEKLEVDHIIPFVEVMGDQEKLFDVNNGRTLCKPCHSTTDTYAKKRDKIVL